MDETPTPPRWTILVADDDAAVCRLVRATISPDDYRVLEAAAGDAAWALLQAHRPHVALLDVALPGQDGLALTRAIKRDPALAQTCVILLSGHRHSEDFRLGQAAGADFYLVKPFSPLEMLRLIEQYLRVAGAQC